MSRSQNYSHSLYGQASSERRSLRSRRDDRASHSGSEDGHYDTSKLEDDGADNALTTQTLNADGTPKRPMNAFMIFARRRRPQVSAENQALRTGEVSKLLSKEWSSMAASDKHFYQEQAKLLKESFNSKYPDYVYRRRPNNSRRRRRSDASLRGADDMGGDMGEDGVSPGGFESPTEGDDHFDSGSDYSYTARPSHEAPVFGDTSNVKYSGRNNSSNDMFFRGGTMGDSSRLPFAPPPPDRNHPMPPPLLTPRMQPPAAYGYGQLSSSSTGGESFNGPQGWSPRGQRSQAMWNGPMHQERNNATLDLKPIGMNSPDTWNNSPTSSTSSTNSSHNLFASLNPSFNPNQPHIPSYKTTSSSTSQYSSSNPMHLSSNRSYDPRGTSMVGLGEPLVYPSRGMSRDLPPVHTIPGYSSQPTSSSGQMGPNSGYQWPREFNYLNARSDLDLMSVSNLKDEP